MLSEFRRKLDQLKPEARSQVASQHFPFIEFVCQNLRGLTSCAYQQKVLQQVERLMSLGRNYLEHVVPEPFPWPEDAAAFLTIAPGDCSHCGRVQENLEEKMQMWGAEAKRFFFGTGRDRHQHDYGRDE